VLNDLTKVTLVNCTSVGPGHATRGEGRYTFEEVFPHYVVLGERHIDPAGESISSAHIVIGDAADLFYDFDAFGYVLYPQPFISHIARSNDLDREIEVGPNPKILYFTGKDEVLAVDTEIGRISVNHNPRHNFGGPHGVWLKNTIVVTVEFPRPVRFSELTFHTFTLIRYLGLLVGRPQSLVPRRNLWAIDGLNRVTCEGRKLAAPHRTARPIVPRPGGSPSSPAPAAHRSAASGLDRDTPGREFGIGAVNDAIGSPLR
jgi:hypothetical protein